MLKAALVVVLLPLAVVPPQQTPPPVPTTTPAPTPAQAASPTFEEFLAGVRTEARTRGIRQSTIDAALTGIEPNPVVVARDRAQPELTQSLDDYLTQRLTPTRIDTGQTMVKTHAGLLEQIEKAYGLNGPVMVAVWGLESNFGAFTGTYQTITSLATLAYDGRRPLFREELFAALKIIDAGHATAADLKGSWAGAMGQPQFMPSSFLRTAVDFDGDGRMDIWSTLADVFASMANYLKNAGWQTGERWGREVLVSKEAIAAIDRSVPMRTSGCRSIREMTVARPLETWTKLGVTLTAGEPLPSAAMTASLVRGQSRYFLGYRNYEALLAYNCSHAYALSVGLLADKIAAPQK